METTRNGSPVKSWPILFLSLLPENPFSLSSLPTGLAGTDGWGFYASLRVIRRVGGGGGGGSTTTTTNRPWTRRKGRGEEKGQEGIFVKTRDSFKERKGEKILFSPLSFRLM